MVLAASDCRRRPNSKRFSPSAIVDCRRAALDVLVDARVVQLAQRAQNLVELARIDVLGRQVAPQRLRLAGPLPHLTAQLADVFLGQAPVATSPTRRPSRRPSWRRPRRRR